MSITITLDRADAQELLGMLEAETCGLHTLAMDEEHVEQLARLERAQHALQTALED